MDDMIELKRRMRAVKAQNFYGSIIRDALGAIDLLQDKNIKLRDATAIAERKRIAEAMRNIAAMLHLPGDPQYPGDERHTEKRMLLALADAAEADSWPNVELTGNPRDDHEQ